MTHGARLLVGGEQQALGQSNEKREELLQKKLE
jgi:hypothetical protein